VGKKLPLGGRKGNVLPKVVGGNKVRSDLNSQAKVIGRQWRTAKALGMCIKIF
jgi:hypothetical protein